MFNIKIRFNYKNNKMDSVKIKTEGLWSTNNSKKEIYIPKISNLRNIWKH